MEQQTKQFWKSTFQPDSKPADLFELRDAYFTARKEYGLHSLVTCAKLAPSLMNNGLGKAINELSEKAPDSATSLFDDPVFMTWSHFLNRAVARDSKDEVQLHCNNLAAVLERVKNRLTGSEALYVPETTIALQQEDIDPYIMAATPPSYDFIEKLSSEEVPNGYGHPLKFQQELMGIAMQNIEKAWPELKLQILEVVKIIGYLPDATFRSCSASRYAGVVYLGNMDERILDIEESIVHEAGHQVLYRLGELVPLCKEGTSQEPDYELPWSGSKRDLFGFLHAFYIYTLLTKYFWKRGMINEKEKKDCVQRAALIMIGTRLAIPMLLGAKDLTEQGRSLVEILAADMDKLQSEMEIVYKISNES